jgi:hypothetical protein
MEGIQMYTRGMARALRRRIEWTSQTCTALGDAAGSRADAAALVLPLLGRMRLRGDDAERSCLLALATTPPQRGQPPPVFRVC